MEKYSFWFLFSNFVYKLVPDNRLRMIFMISAVGKETASEVEVWESDRIWTKEQSAISPRDLISPYTTISSLCSGRRAGRHARDAYRGGGSGQDIACLTQSSALIPDVVNTTLIDSSHYKVGHFRGQNTLLLPPSTPSSFT